MAQVVKVVGRQQQTIHEDMDATLYGSAFRHPHHGGGGGIYGGGGIPYISNASAADPLWSAAKAHDRQYETDIAFASLQLPAGFSDAILRESGDTAGRKLPYFPAPVASDFCPAAASGPDAAGAAAAAAAAYGGQSRHRQRSRERLFLPVYCRYVAWFLCVFASIAAAFFAISLGINFGPKKSSIWLQAVYFALVQVSPCPIFLVLLSLSYCPCPFVLVLVLV